MKVSYYPGCTLKTKARNLDETVTECMKALGVDFQEMPRWNCCGAVLSLADDDVLRLVAPVRDLIRVKEAGHGTMVTACSMCYNTISRANLVVRGNEEKRKTLNSFMEEEIDYAGEVEVLHVLQFLREKLGWDQVRAKVRNPLTGLRVAPYYGCTLLRPQEIAIDTRDHPMIFQEFIEATGAVPVDFPASQDCCGTYQIVSHRDVAVEKCQNIVRNAREWKADVIASSCPLCEFNLGNAARTSGFEGLPTLYFTQLLAIALGLPQSVCHFELNTEGTRKLLEERKLLPA